MVEFLYRLTEFMSLYIIKNQQEELNNKHLYSRLNIKIKMKKLIIMFLQIIYMIMRLEYVGNAVIVL